MRKLQYNVRLSVSALRRDFIFVHVLCWMLFAMLCLASSLSAQTDSTFKLSLLDGTSVNGEITAVDERGSIAGKNFDGLNFRDVVSVDLERQVAPSESKLRLVLAGGGVLSVGSPSVDSDFVRFSTEIQLEKLPLQSVRAIVWRPSDSIQRSINQPSLENDRVHARGKNGEIVLEGILEKVTGTHVHVQYKGESRKILLERVDAVVTADLGLAKPQGSLAKVQTVDGSFVVGKILEYRDGRWRLETTGVKSIELPNRFVASIQIATDRVRYLSDLEPKLVEEKPVFAIQLPWQKDRSVGNNPLQILDAERSKVLSFNKGLGVQSFSRLEFENDGFDRFAVTVGIDNETRGHGDCRMVVQGDGIELWSGRVTPETGPKDLDLEIQGIETVSLIVYPGDEFDLGDHANWANARFLKTR